MRTIARTELVCQGYHAFEAIGEYDRLEYPHVYSDEPEAKEWRAIEDRALDPRGKPVWLCPLCQRRYFDRLFNGLCDARMEAAKKYAEKERKLRWALDDLAREYREELAEAQYVFEKLMEPLGYKFVDGQWTR